jgi:uncharacterized lipoprotein YmbA
MTMKKLLFSILIMMVVAALAACNSEPPKRVYPPKASVQELRAGADGRWTLKIRLENFSTMPMTFSTVTGKLTVAGQEAGEVSLQISSAIGPESADVFTTTLTPALAGKIAVADALASRKTVRYALVGKISSREPQRDFDFSHESALSPVPGLDGVLR